ncbi:MAG: Rpn family recombination-promoting nuclease/putative transposase [Firmicutes bacterium]|nr:Rpn family recombination-promoting nuclease/putative transposase [Bacillota bacterium]
MNALLHREGADAIAQVSVANSERTANRYGGKTKRLDIYAQTDRAERINLEIQVGREPATVPRALLYWASVFEAQAVQGMDYQDLAPTLSINVLNL